MPRSAQEYKSDLLLLRRFVAGYSPADGYDLRHGLTSAQKRRITMQATELQSLLARPAKVYRPRDPRRLRVAQSESHGGRKIKGLKVAFVSVPEPSRPAKVTITKAGKMRVVQRGVSRTLINIDPVSLARDPIGAVNRAIEHHPARLFGIQAGEHRVEALGAIRNGIHAFTDKTMIGSQVAKLISNYGSDKFDAFDKNSHHFKNWLFGLIAFEYQEFSDYRAYQAAFARQRELIKRSPLGKRLALVEGKPGKKKSRKKGKRVR